MGDENINKKIEELLDNYYNEIVNNKNNYSLNINSMSFEDFQKKEILIKHNYIEKVKIILRWKM